MDTGTVAITCSGAELFFLSALLGGRALLGVEDPFYGRADDINAAMQQAQASLVARRYLEVLPGGTLRLDETVAAIAAVVTYPSATFLVTSAARSGAAERRTYYVRQPAAVELAHDQGDEYRLTGLAGAEGVLRRIQALWSLDGQAAAPGERCTLREAALQQASRQITGEASAPQVQATLAQVGLSATAARALAETLVTAQRNGALAVVRPGEGDWETAGLAVLAGASGLWRLHTSTRDGEPWVEAVPTSGAALAGEVHELIARFAPENAGPPPVAPVSTAPNVAGAAPETHVAAAVNTTVAGAPGGAVHPAGPAGDQARR